MEGVREVAWFDLTKGGRVSLIDSQGIEVRFMVPPAADDVSLIAYLASSFGPGLTYFPRPKDKPNGSPNHD